MKVGAGALFLTTKPEEPDLIRKWAKSVGREMDICEVTAAGPHTMNMLELAVSQKGLNSAGGTEGIVSLLNEGTDLVDRNADRKSGDNAIWESARNAFTRNLVDALRIVGAEIQIHALSEFVATAPRTRQEAESLRAKIEEIVLGRSEANALSVAGRVLLLVRLAIRTGETDVDSDTCRATWDYWMKEWVNLPQKTMGSIEFTWGTLVGALKRGDLAALCMKRTTLHPSALRNGSIVVLNLPTREFGDAGRVVQGMMKYLFQKELERGGDGHDKSRPVLLAIDEAAGFLTPYDVTFQSTARSSRVCTLMATQSLASVRQVLGSDGAETLLGVLQTKVIHSVDGETSRWAADLIGQDWDTQMTFQNNGGYSFSQQMKYKVEPIRFSQLARGGPENGLLCEAVVFKPGARWNGENFVKVAFSQR